jgi:hypothetical protein
MYTISFQHIIICKALPIILSTKTILKIHTTSTTYKVTLDYGLPQCAFYIE